MDWSQAREVFSEHLGANLVILPNVLDPSSEAEGRVLPYMKTHRALFEDKDVLDIATGSGVIGLYAAALGARRVVATDINPAAVICAKENARRLRFDDRFEVRLVSPEDSAAFSVIAADETFDAIVSNPPFSLNLEADANDIWVDRGHLGFSLIMGLENHLKKGGTAVLFYGSLFYHQVMAMLARYLGYAVENWDPEGMTPWERDAVFNHYLGQLLRQHHLEPKTLRFDWTAEKEKHREALERHMKERSFRGLIVVTKTG